MSKNSSIIIFEIFFILLIVSIVLPYSLDGLEPDSEDSLLIVAPGIQDVDFLSDLEKEVVREVNRARTNPVEYAECIEDYKRFYAGNYIYIAGQTPILTKEGVSAVNEAIQFLKSQSPIPALKVSKGLSLSSCDLVKDQGPTGLVGHKASDGSNPGDRMNRYGSWRVVNGENVEYGNFSAREIVMQLIIDDGVQNRGHRKNIFKEKFILIGVCCGSHNAFGEMCVMDFAGSYTEQAE